MNEFLARLLKQLGYRHEATQMVKVDNLHHKARYEAIAIKTKDGRVYIARHLGTSEADAEHKLVKMLQRP